MKHRSAGTVRAVLEGEKRIIEVLAAPFGSPAKKDRLNQYLSARTNFMIEVGDKRPTLYMHGFSPQMRRMKNVKQIGTPAEVTRVDNDGLWMKTELDNSELATRTWEAAKKGTAKASTGAIDYLEDHNELTGEVNTWAITELSVFDAGDKRIPVSDDAVVLPIRTLFEESEIQFPEEFEAGEDKNFRIDNKTKEIGENEMDKKELQAAVAQALEDKAIAEEQAVEEKKALRVSVIDELKSDPQYRAIFNIQKETVGTEELTANEQETHEYIWNLRTGNAQKSQEIEYQQQNDGSFRVLEETEAAEGLAFVPQELDTQVQEMRDEQSLVTKLGILRRKSNRLIYNFIREDSGMGALAAIAEEGAYVANEPAFALLPATVGKYGSMITATEELLEDQNIFQSWFVNAVARKWALAENLHLFTVLKAGGTTGTSSATFTQPEIDAYAFDITEPWKDGAHLVMEAATMATIRGLLVATPRAYGDFPNFGGREYPSFMGFQTHLNSNWETVGGGATTVTMSLVNPQAVGWVERQGIKIFVDPYGDSANGRVRFFPRVRFACVNTQALGVVHYLDA